jgi:CHAT domain-containing protein/flagellar biosynthesis regulator FlbT
MLNKAYFWVVLMVLFVEMPSVFSTNKLVQIPNESSNLHQIPSHRQISSFAYSNRKKELNAYVVSKLIAIGKENIGKETYEEVLFQQIKNLLNADLIDEAFVFLDSIESNLAYNYLIPKWKLLFWNGLINNAKSNLILAEEFYIKATNELIKTHLAQADLGLIYFYHGMLLQNQDRRDEAFPMFLRSIELMGLTDIETIEAYRRISTTYTLKGNFQQGLMSINKALSIVFPEMVYSNTNEVLESINIDQLDVFAKLLQSRAYIYREMAKNSIDSVHYLKLSLNDAEVSILAFEKYKRSLVFESDLIYVNSLYRYFYSKTIEAITRLYNATGNDSLLLKAFEYAEMDKASALLYTLQRNKALYNSGIDSKSISELEDLNRKLRKMEAIGYSERFKSLLNDTSLYNINTEIYSLVSAITQKERDLEDAFPVYKATKYLIVPFQMSPLLELSNRKAIVEYVLSNEKLYTFVLVNGKLNFYHQNIDEKFVSNIEVLQQMISDSRSIDFSMQEQEHFVSVSNALYEVLIAPFGPQVNGKPLLIVPDEQLLLVPFEVLVSNPVKPEKLDYSMLDYLIKDHDISYLYSLTLMQNFEEPVAKPKYHEVLAMAPAYKNLAGNKKEQYLAMRDARDNLGNLKGAADEVQLLKSTLSGMILTGNNASEEEFKLNANKFSILHLAMHTLVNNEEPLYSKLIFTPNIDNVEDGLLNTYELADLNLGADLVVLSACNTGYGKLNNGEGIVGLTRGFFQAGCKSILATLWSVSDKTSYDIVKVFYKELEAGHSKSNCISESKRNYLASAKGMFAHPYFWAGFISVGNDQPIEVSQKTYFQYYAITVFLIITLLVGVIYFVRKKKKKPELLPAFSQTK